MLGLSGFLGMSTSETFRNLWRMNYRIPKIILRSLDLLGVIRMCSCLNKWAARDQVCVVMALKMHSLKSRFCSRLWKSISAARTGHQFGILRSEMRSSTQLWGQLTDKFPKLLGFLSGFQWRNSSWDTISMNFESLKLLYEDKKRRMKVSCSMPPQQKNHN